MDGLALNPLVLAGAAGALLLIVLVLVFTLARGRSGGDVPEYLKRVRQLVAQGKHGEAAHVQLQEGNLQEAYNLFARAEDHVEAAKLAERLKLFEKAAAHDEKAGDFKKAAELQGQLGDWAAAGRLYKRTGDFRKAAEALERSGSADIRDLGPLWEKACMDLLPDDTNPADLDPDVLMEIKHCAERAAETFRQAGENDKAALFYDLLQRPNDANALRGRSTTSLLTKMTQLPGLQPGGDATDLIRQASALNASSPELAHFASIVGDAIKQAMAAPQPVILSQEDFQRAVGGAAEAGTVGASTAVREVIYIRDAATNQETPVTRDSERYSILEKLGEGGMAVVFKAHDLVLERDVALKFLPEGLTTNPMALRFFEREAKAAAGLAHPNIVTVYDYGVLDQRPFICMELIEGESMDKHLKDPEHKRGLPIEDLLQVAEGLFSALHAAHLRGVVHRDVKPSNIMFSHLGHVKLMDFGIARGIDPEQATLIVGTPYYMAPEQFLGVGIDARTDIFAAGVTLYELATGSLPFKDQNRLRPPERAIKRREDLPPAIDDLIWRCIQADPDARPASAEHLLQEVRALLRSTRGDAPSSSTIRARLPPVDAPLDLGEFEALFEDAQTIEPRLDGPQAIDITGLSFEQTVLPPGEPDPWSIAFDTTSASAFPLRAPRPTAEPAPATTPPGPPLSDELAHTLLAYIEEEHAVVDPQNIDRLLRSRPQLSERIRRRITQDIKLKAGDEPLRDEVRQMLLDYLNE